MEHHRQFVMLNGSIATIRWLDSRYLKAVATICPLLGKGQYYAVETRLGNEFAYIILIHYLSPYHNFDFLADLLRTCFDETLKKASGIVFRGEYYAAQSHTFAILKKAITVGELPEICALL
jgi:hypothetical protein